jgi:hypothetical protein
MQKRLAPRQMPVIKLSNNSGIEYARLELWAGNESQHSICFLKPILSNHCFKNTIPPQGVISLFVKDNSNLIGYIFLTLRIRIYGAKMTLFSNAKFGFNKGRRTFELPPKLDTKLLGYFMYRHYSIKDKHKAIKLSLIRS